MPDREEVVPAIFSQEIVLFPRMQVVLVISEERGRGAVAKALQENHLVAFVPSEYETKNEGIGVLALVVSNEQTSKGLRVELRGLWRVRVVSDSDLGSGPGVKIRRVEDEENSEKDEVQTVNKVHAQIDEFRELIPDIPTEIITLLSSASSAAELSDLCAMSPTLTHRERLELLSTLDPVERLTMLNKHFDRELEALRSMAETKPIPECEICADLADKAFDADEEARAEAIVQLLNHMVGIHTTELLNVLAEKYGPTFMKRRELR